MVSAPRDSDLCCLDVDIYLRMARKQNLDSIVYVPKVFIIYDDLSYDAHMGDPRYLFEELGVKFNKGGYQKTSEA